MKSDGSTEAFLLGLAVSALDQIQHHLVQGEEKEALSVTNEAVRKLSAEINKHFYPKGEKENVGNEG